MKKKFKILSEFGTPLPLKNAERIVFLLPYEDGRTLEKASVEILDFENSIVELTLTDFEVQGLKAELKQNCKCRIYTQNGDLYTVLFSKGMNIDLKDGKKVWI